MKKVIYIMGAGRSGTTLLDIILGNAQDCFSSGETVRHAELNGIPHGFAEETETYQFWKKIDEVLTERNGTKLDLKNLQHTTHRLEFHQSIFLDNMGLIPRKEKDIYKNYINLFYDVLFDNIEEDIIIDSSKYAGRAYALLKYLDREICFIYLLRDPVDVVRSFAKTDVEQPSKNYFDANAYYFVINNLCRMVINKIKRSKHKFVAISYDSLLNSPEETLKKISESFGIDMSKPISSITNNEELAVGRLFEGNRIRLKESIKLQALNKSKRSGIKDLLTSLINGWWYKYAER